MEVVKLLAKEGFLGLWQKLLGMIENFKQTVIGGLRDLVITSVVRAGLGWLAGLANPIGGIVKICLAIYDMIVVFLERLEQIRAFVGSIFSSVAAIARGQVQAAGDFIERSLGAAVPLVISFLAAILGLNTIPQKIREVIGTGGSGSRSIATTAESTFGAGQKEDDWTSRNGVGVP